MNYFDFENLQDWVPLSEVPNQFPQFSYNRLKRLFWKRDEHLGLSSCYRRVGRVSYVNVRLFALWMAGALPEQKR